MERVITKKHFLVGLALFILGITFILISYFTKEILYGRFGGLLLILIVYFYIKRLRDLSK